MSFKKLRASEGISYGKRLKQKLWIGYEALSSKNKS